MARPDRGTRQALIVAAVEAFGAHGFEATTLDSVATAAGVRKQTLLYYFPTKAALFDACVDAVAERVVVVLEDALSVSEEGWERVEAIIRSAFGLAAEWPEFPRFIREASRRGPEVVGRFATRLLPLRERAVAALERGMREGRFRRQDPALLLFTLYTAVVGSLTEAGVLRAVAGGSRSRTALRRRERELLRFLRAALEP